MQKTSGNALIRSVSLILFLMASVAHAEKATAPGAVDLSRINLTGSRIIGCCCAAPCPCRVNKPPMHNHGCDHTDAVHINQGHIGKTRMDGVTYVIVGRGFGESTAGNWAHLYVDEKATEDQVKALNAFLESAIKSWGPKAPYLAGKFLGMKKVPMQYTVSADRRDYNVVIPNVLDLKTHSIILPGHRKPVVSTGIFDAFGDQFVHADALTHTYNDPQLKYSWNLSGRQANQADFVLTAAAIKMGGIGWGCWAAHASFGSKEKYQQQMIEH